MAAPVDEPWWASGTPDGTIGGEDPLDAHRAGRGAGEEQRRAGGAGGHGSSHGSSHGSAHGPSVDACGVCPICAGIRILGEVRPELVTHLSEAARHLTLAAKVFIDAQAEVLRRDDGLQHIDLDDE